MTQKEIDFFWQLLIYMQYNTRLQIDLHHQDGDIRCIDVYLVMDSVIGIKLTKYGDSVVLSSIHNTPEGLVRDFERAITYLSAEYLNTRLKSEKNE